MRPAVGLALAIGLLGPAAPTWAAPAIRAQNVPDPGQLFTSDDLLWFEVRVGDTLLAESMDAYASRAGVYLPLAQFSRVLDLPIGAFPVQGRAEGWVNRRENRLVVDLPSGEASIGDRTVRIQPGQAQVSGEDIFLRLDLLEQLLPVRLQVDVSAQLLRVQATEPLPFQLRVEREQRIRRLGDRPATATAMRIQTPYTAFTPPVFDVNLGGQLTRDGVDDARRFDLRAAGDLAYGGLQAFLGSDEDGELADARISLTRKDVDNRALGPLGGTRAGIGDVFSPSMPIGMAGVSGRGLYYTSASLEALDIATPLNLRGELALGEEVELYVNEVLQAARSSADQGRYEFLDVPLTYGLNVVRLVFYDTQGQSREVVRRINFGQGQVQPGQSVLRLGVVEQGLPVFSAGRDPVDPQAGALRASVQVDYGVSERLTLAAGLGLHTPADGDARILGLVGARASLGAAAVQLDAALDDHGGSGATASMSTRLFGAALLARHSEYGGGFVDETRQLGVSAAFALRRATDLRADMQLRGPGDVTLPFSLDARRLERFTGDVSSIANARLALPLGRYYASTSLTWEDDTESPGGPRVYGASDLATLVRSGFQLRGGLTYTVQPDARLDAAYVNLDFDLNERQAIRLGAVRTLLTDQTSLQASSLWRTRTFDVALNGSWQAETGDWRLGLQFGVSLGYDSRLGRYRALRPGAAAGGSASIDAFIDENGDGLRQAGETGLPGVAFETPGGVVQTDADGFASVSGLGDGARSRMRIDASDVDDPFLIGGPTELEITPRPGRMVDIAWPMRRTAEVEARAVVLRADGGQRPLAALDVELIDAEGRIIAGRTDHAGVVLFQGVAPGEYQLRLAAAQADALALELDAPVPVRIEPAGGYLDAGSLRVRVKTGARQ